jgi:hypothetical protein
MKPCYYNIENKKKIDSGELQPCTTLVPDNSYMCDEHKKEYWKNNEPKRGKYMTIPQIQAKLKQMGKNKLPSNLAALDSKELTYWKHKLAIWIEKNESHPKLNDVSKKYDEIESLLDNIKS